MAVKNISLLALLALSGCSVFTSLSDVTSQTEQEKSIELEQTNSSPLGSSIGFQNQFKQKFHLQNSQQQTAADSQMLVAELKGILKQSPTLDSKQHNINHYVRGLMQDLISNLQYVNFTTPVAVASFVMLDSNYNESNLLGIQIAESLIHEVHKFGIPVIDFKTTGYIRVTEQGDFAFSKDYEDFSGDMPARYIVGGTMLKDKDGYLINARIVGVKSQAVVASAQSFIPNSVSESILKHSEESRLRNLRTTTELGEALPLDKTTNNAPSNIVSLIQE